MSIKGTLFKLGVFSLVLLVFTAIIVVVFGEIRFNRTAEYSAIFKNVSGLRGGQFVRASGVEVGKVSSVELINGGQEAEVTFSVDRTLPLFDQTTAAVRYLDLIGNRYLELKRGQSNQIMAPGSTIPVQRTEPALDLDALVGGFRPLFQSLDAEKVNTIANSIVTVFQGQGGTISDILDQTTQLTQSIADRDRAIGEVITNLNTVLDTTVRHQKQFDETLKNFEALITGLKSRADPIGSSVANISNVAGSLADLLSDNRPLLKDSVGYLDAIEKPLVEQRAQVDEVLRQLPAALKILGRAGGIYGDFFNFYACDITLKLNGAQPGGPVRNVRITSQPSGRCAPR